MFFENVSGYKAARTGMATLAISLAATLAACGGDSDGGGAKPAANKAAESALAGTTPVTFDGVFLKDGGAGYYEFGATTASATGKTIATARSQLYVNKSSDQYFSQTVGRILGPNVLSSTTEVYITASGAVSPPNNLTGTYTRIFQKLPQGYQSGIAEISTPLHEITIGAVDVSGLPVVEAIGKDKAAATNGLNAVLGSVAATLPERAQMYQSSLKVLTTHLRFKVTAKHEATSLDQLQPETGGTIGTLGGYRYLAGGTQTYIDYNGAIYAGHHPAGIRSGGITS